ncbi:MAG: hypothetical protein CMJ41_08450 [Phycisphaerae bacterium]|nr:hypothetical protein [Phycisphaerae bacterium]
MGRRQSKPALLELFKNEQQDVGASRPGGPASQAWEPGRSVRVTAGHLLVSIAVVMVLIVMTWMIAFRQGELQARAELESVIFQPVLEDPVLDPSASVRLAEGEPVAEAVAEEALVGDPRQQGFFYFVLAETRLEGALRLARFCRELGLETWVIPRDNAGLARVIALPGVVTTSRTEEACRVLDERIGAIGLRWKESGGTSSLEDRYLVRWDG